MNEHLRIREVVTNLGETVKNVQFLGCTFGATTCAGLDAGPSIVNSGKAFFTNGVIVGNTASGNAANIQGAGIGICNSSGHRVVNIIVTCNNGDGICLRNGGNIT